MGERVTSQNVGSSPVASWRRLAQRDTSACLAPGASSSLLHEWLRKAVTSPIAAGSVRAWSVLAHLTMQWICPRGPRRAAGWRAGNEGASPRVRALRREHCRRRAPRPTPPLPPRYRGRPVAPGGGGGGYDCGPWVGRHIRERRRLRRHMKSDRSCFLPERSLRYWIQRRSRPSPGS